MNEKKRNYKDDDEAKLKGNWKSSDDKKEPFIYT